MTTEHEATRTLVKSPPELWAECSDAGSLARHLGEFGEIQITRLEPETTVAWEGENASGTVRIEPSGWGTRVTLTAQRKVEEAARVDRALADQAEDEAPVEQVEDEATDEPVEEEVSGATLEETPEAEDPAVEAELGRIRWRLRRVSARFRGAFVRGEPEPATEPEVPDEPVNSVPPPEPQPTPEEAQAELVATTEALPEEPAAAPSLDAGAVLTAALDSLGQAHHRPFSRA